MKHTAILTTVILILTSMTFKYDNKNFSFETTEQLKSKKSSTSEWDDKIIFEQEFENKSKQINVSFRIIDFSKQGKIINPSVKDDTVLEIVNDYLNDIKMTGSVENIEQPQKIQDNWIYYSAIARISKDLKSSNVYYSKRIDNWVLVISIGSINTNIAELKVLGQKISSTFKNIDK